MSTEALKLELIRWVGGMTDKKSLKQLQDIKKKMEEPPKSDRAPGWGKDFFLYVADDFDETPVGFEEYMPAK
jgi:hypothetical protein